MLVRIFAIKAWESKFFNFTVNCEPIFQAQMATCIKTLLNSFTAWINTYWRSIIVREYELKIMLSPIWVLYIKSLSNMHAQIKWKCNFNCLHSSFDYYHICINICQAKLKFLIINHLISVSGVAMTYTPSLVSFSW